MEVAIMIKELAKEVVSANADIDISNEAKKRSAVAYINRKLIESRQYTYDNATNAVGIDTGGYGRIWYNADAFLKI